MADWQKVKPLPRGGMYWVVLTRGSALEEWPFTAVYGHSLIINLSQGMYQKIHDDAPALSYNLEIFFARLDLQNKLSFRPPSPTQHHIAMISTVSLYAMIFTDLHVVTHVIWKINMIQIQKNLYENGS